MKNKREIIPMLEKEIQEIEADQKERLGKAYDMLYAIPPETDIGLRELGEIHDATHIPYCDLTRIRSAIRRAARIPYTEAHR